MNTHCHLVVTVMTAEGEIFRGGLQPAINHKCIHKYFINTPRLRLFYDRLFLCLNYLC